MSQAAVGGYMRETTFLEYNIQAPYKNDCWDFSSQSYGEPFGNYPCREMPRTVQAGRIEQAEQTGQTGRTGPIGQTGPTGMTGKT